MTYDVVYTNPFFRSQCSSTDAMITLADLCKERAGIPDFLIIPRIGLDKFLSGNSNFGSSAGRELRLKSWLPTTLANSLVAGFGMAEGALTVETLGEPTGTLREGIPGFSWLRTQVKRCPWSSLTLGETPSGEVPVVVFKITRAGP